MKLENWKNLTVRKRTISVHFSNRYIKKWEVIFAIVVISFQPAL